MYPEDDSKISPHAAELSASPVESSSAENDTRTPLKGRFAYIKSPRFWLVLLIGYEYNQ